MAGADAGALDFRAALGDQASNWRSVRPGKISWNEKLVASVAAEMLESLPERALNLIRSSGFQGADLIKLESEIHRPSFREIAANYIWLKPMVRQWPTSVPGALVLTDVFLYLDQLLDGTLLCKPGVAKVVQASEEGGVKSFHPRVGELKSMLRPSPASAVRRRLARRPVLEDDDMNEALEDATSDAGEDDSGDVEASNEDGSSSSEDDSEDHHTANPGSPCHDDDETLVLGEVSPDPLPAAEADQSDESELDGGSEVVGAAGVTTDAPCDAVPPFDKSYHESEESDSSDGESLDLGADVPNLPADSKGNTAHGFNLACLHVPPFPPSPASSAEDDGDGGFVGALKRIEESRNARKYITPAKRHAPDHEEPMSTVKIRKEKGKASDAAVDKSWVEKKVESPKDVEDTGSESELSGDTLIPSSPWEKPTIAERKRWKAATKKALEESFHEALGIMGIDDPMPSKLPETSVKMPSLKPPTSFDAVVDDLMMCDAPFIGPQVNPKKKKESTVKGKVLKEKKGGNKKASFRRRHGHPKRAAAPRESHEAVEAEASVNPPPHPEPSDLMYHEYNLTKMEIPRNALPSPDKVHHGCHSYTVNRGAARIEVLLRAKAFVVKGSEKFNGQITWSKFGGVVSAWISACTKAGVLP